MGGGSEMGRYSLPAAGQFSGQQGHRGMAALAIARGGDAAVALQQVYIGDIGGVHRRLAMGGGLPLEKYLSMASAAREGIAQPPGIDELTLQQPRLGR